jgi:hypothetical protein
MSKAGLGRILNEELKLKITINSARAQAVLVTNSNTGDIKLFTSIRRASKYIGMHHSYFAKCLVKNNIYKGNIFIVVLSSN